MTSCPAISIVVPVYRVEKYLQRCIDSILSQTFTDWELILIDDGSPDNSGVICDDYARKDSRIRVIHQKNKGAATARNVGITESHGQYIGFVDSDDEILPEMYEKLITTATNSDVDMAICNFVQTDTSGEIICRHNLPVGQKLENAECRNFLFERIMQCDTPGYFSLCNKIYRRSIISDNHLTIPDDISFGEDLIFNIRFMQNMNSCIGIDDVNYRYYQGSGGLFQRYRVSFLHDIMCCRNLVLDVIRDCFKDNVNSLAVEKKYYNYILRYIKQAYDNDPKYKSVILRALKNKDVLSCFRNILEYEKVLKKPLLDVPERRIAKMACYNFSIFAVQYIIYIFNEQHPVRKIKDSIGKLCF